ncbi:MAG: ABC transporter permease [Actinomycetota bacterium]
MMRRSRIPIFIWLLAAIALALFSVPLLSLVIRAPWSDLGRTLSSSVVHDALKLSLICSAIATIVCVVIGVPCAWVLAYSSLPGKSAFRSLCTLSMVLPPVVSGVALIAALGRRGVVGQFLFSWWEIQIPFTIVAVVIAETFVALPFLILTVDAALRQLDPVFDESARVHGATSWYAFRRVILPSIRPALISGIVLAWARALGEFGATITFAGNLQGRTQTVPSAVFLALERDRGEAITLSLILVGVSLAVLVSLRDRWITAVTRGGSW